MKQLVIVDSTSELIIIKQKLEKAGIPYFEMSNIAIDGNPEIDKVKGIKIMVNDSDYEKAVLINK